MEGPIRSYTDLLRNDAKFFVQYRRKLMAKGIFKLPINSSRYRKKAIRKCTAVCARS